MKILQAFGEPISNGGQESFVMNMVTHMNLSDKQVDLLTPYYCDNEFYKKKIDDLGGKIFTFNKKFQPGKSRFNICSDLDKFFKENKYDVVHVHSGSISIFGIYAYYAKKHGVKKVIVHSHSSIERKNIKNTVLRYACIFFLKKNVDVYCACSQIAGESKFVSSVTKEKLIVLKNGIEVDKFGFNLLKRVELRKQLDVNETEFVIGHVGRFSDEKNHAFLIDVFAEFLKLKPESKLMLIGSGELENEIKEKVNILNITDKVIFIGNVNNVYDYYQAMDCFVLPSKFEGLGMVGIEAQAAGLPCFVSNGCPKELKITENLEYISLSDSPQKWAKAILKKSNIERKDVSEEIDNAGFDVREEIVRIEKMYKEGI